MAGCCDPRGCDRIFGPRVARSAAAGYRRRGLDKESERIVSWLEQQGVQDASVLEIGGGIGSIQIELLTRGAAQTTNLELSPAYDSEAWALAAEAGVADRMTRQLGDIAVDDGVAPVHDFVVLNRVVCCYPDYQRLLSAAARHARRGVVFSHPPRNALTVALIAVENFALRLVRREYQTFMHPPAQMRAVLPANGLDHVEVRGSHVWAVVSASRTQGG